MQSIFLTEEICGEVYESLDPPKLGRFDPAQFYIISASQLRDLPLVDTARASKLLPRPVVLPPKPSRSWRVAAKQLLWGLVLFALGAVAWGVLVDWVFGDFTNTIREFTHSLLS